MIPKQKLNVNAPKAITDFEAVAKEFELSEKLYRIIFRGKGLEFDKYREYSPDEDASNIDWKASLRSNKLMAKQYIEERELNIIFVVDDKIIINSHLNSFSTEKKFEKIAKKNVLTSKNSQKTQKIMAVSKNAQTQIITVNLKTVSCAHSTPTAMAASMKIF